MKYKAVKITGINGFEFFVGKTSIWHDNAIKAKSIGVKVEIIETNYKYNEILNNLELIEVYTGNINKNKIANKKQIWNLGRHIINETCNPYSPTEGIATKMCA